MEMNVSGGIGVSDLENEGASYSLPGGDSLVDLHVVSDRLGVCTRTVHRLIASGELPPPVKVGRASRWFTSDIERYLNRLRQARTRLQLPTLMERGAA